MASIKKTEAANAITLPRDTPTKGEVKISDLRVGDRGLKAKIDANTNSIKIAGTARGIETRSPGNPNETSEYLKTEEFGGGMSVQWDMERMPEFDTSRGYTEKNKWYFAHTASIGTKQGQTPVEVARALAAKINENSDYSAKVKVAPNGSALIQINRG